MKGRAFMDTLEGAILRGRAFEWQFLKAEPSWTPWKGQNERQSLRGHFGRAKKKGMAFMDTF